MTRLDFLRQNCIVPSEEGIKAYHRENPSRLVTERFISLSIGDNEVVELYQSPVYQGMYYVYVLNKFSRARTHQEISGRIILTKNKYRDLYMCS